MIGYRGGRPMQIDCALGWAVPTASAADCTSTVDEE